MKKRYGIGFLIGMIVFTLVLIVQCVNWRQNKNRFRKSRKT